MPTISSTTVSSTALLKGVSSSPGAGGATQVPPGILALPSGTVLKGEITKIDGRGNAILTTLKGDVSLKTELPIKLGSEVSLRLTTSHEGIKAKILSVNGLSPQEFTQRSTNPRGQDIHVDDIVQTGKQSNAKAVANTTQQQAAATTARSAALAPSVQATRPTEVFTLKAVLLSRSPELPQILQQLPSSIYVPNARLEAGALLTVKLAPNSIQLPQNIASTSAGQATNIAPPTAPNAATSTTATATTPSPAPSNVASPTSQTVATTNTPNSSPTPTNTASVPPTNTTASIAGSQTATNTTPPATNVQTPSTNTPQTSSTQTSPPTSTTPTTTTPPTTTTGQTPTPATTTASTTMTNPTTSANIAGTTPPSSATPGANSPTNATPAANQLSPTNQPTSPPTATTNSSAAPSTTSTATAANPPAVTTVTPTTTQLAQGMIPAQIIGHEQSGETVLKTALGTLKISIPSPSGAVANLPIGTTMNLRLDMIQLPPNLGQIAAQTSNVPAPISELSMHWNSLQETLQVIAQSQPAMAAQILDNIIPKPGPRMAAAMLFFVSALRGGNINQWLGADTIQLLEKNNRGDLIKKLTAEFGTLRQFFVDSPSPNWQAAFVPVHDGEKWQQAGLFLKKEPENAEDDEAGSTRFIMEVELSRMGPMQFDGFIRKRADAMQFDLIIRSQNTLSDVDRQNIRDIYEGSAELTGIKGGISFQVATPFPILPMQEILSDAPDVMA